jgi:hypothetical protein
LSGEVRAVVRIVQRSIRENVGLDALEDAEVLAEGLVELVDRAVLLGDFLDRQSASRRAPMMCGGRRP